MLANKTDYIFQVDTGHEGSSGAELKGSLSWAATVPQNICFKLMVVLPLYLMSEAAVTTFREGPDTSLSSDHA